MIAIRFDLHPFAPPGFLARVWPGATSGRSFPDQNSAYASVRRASITKQPPLTAKWLIGADGRLTCQWSVEAAESTVFDRS
jgi:hypothetical protein